jgi:hypothetical protein
MQETIDLDKFFTTHGNLTGKKFGRLIVVSFYEWIPKIKQSKWLCKCSCGNYTYVLGGNLKKGTTKSCGCLQKERASEANISHGGGGTRLYNIWKGIRHRCYDKNASNYKYYGEKGISVYKDWDDFSVFREWSMDNGYKENLSIDRIDSSKNYEPSNCQWITRSENTAKGNHERSLRNEIF